MVVNTDQIAYREPRGGFAPPRNPPSEWGGGGVAPPCVTHTEGMRVVYEKPIGVGGVNSYMLGGSLHL